MKKIISILLSLIMIISIIPNVLAATDDQINQEREVLDALGIMSIENNSEFVTRKEFFTGLLHMILDSVDETQVQDILVSRRILFNKSNNLFAGDNYITYNDAVASVVDILGYEPVVQMNGGYPEGYIKVAQDIGILKGVVGSRTLSIDRGSLAKLFYNAIDVSPFVQSFKDKDVIGEVEKGETILSIERKIYKIQGIVEANQHTSLIEVSGNYKDQITINGQKYYINGTNAGELLGCSVNGYIQTNEDDDEKVIFLGVNERKTKELTIQSEDVISLSSDCRKLKYLREGSTSSSKMINISPTVRVIYNGKFYDQYTDTDFILENGHLRLIDNDSDNVYDCIFINMYETMIVNHTTFNNEIYGKYSYSDALNYLIIEEQADNENIHYYLDVNEVTFSTIQTDDVLTIQRKAKIEQYLRTIVPIIAKYEAVRDICITNEPNFDTRTYPDFYNPKFREYLLGLYGDISTINQKYGTLYSSVDAITMPGEFSKSAIFYDWICFNEDMLTEWNAWMASIIKEYTSKPVHCKIMSYMIPSENDDRKELTFGVDAEKFDTFSDYAGNDATSSIGHTPTLTTKMMWYDYLSSITGKPIYNSEDHFISDGSTTYSEAQKDTVRYNLWQGAIHGRAISTMWVWARTYDSGSDLANSILTRPDCVAEAGYTSLDMMRNADDIIKLSSQKPEVALFYSKTSRVFNDNYMEYLHRYYQALLYSGKSVGFVTETSLDKLSDYKYLVIPYVEYTTPEALAAVNSFIDNGGKVIYYADREGYFGSNYKCMTKDKFGNSMDNAKIESKGTRFSTRDTDEVATAFQNYFTNDRVRIIDNSTGKNAAKVEYVYEVGTDGSVLVNIVNHNGSNKTVSVYLDGEKINEMKNVLTGEDMGGSYTLEQYVPLTLKLKHSVETPSVPKNLKYNVNILSWDDDDNAVLYSVYYTDTSGDEILLTKTENNYCTGLGYGIYTVIPENSLGEQGPAATLNAESHFDIKFNSVKLMGGVNVSVNVKNNSTSRQRAVVKIITSKGKVAISDVWLASMEDIDIQAALRGSSDYVVASVGSNYNSDYDISVRYEN